MAFLTSFICGVAFLAPSIDQPNTMVSASDKYLFVSCRRLHSLAIYDRMTRSSVPKLKLTVPVTGDIKAQGAFSNGKFAIVYALDNLKVWRTLVWDGKLHAMPDIPYWESVDGNKGAILSYVIWQGKETLQVSFTFGDGIGARATYVDQDWYFDPNPHGNDPTGSSNLSYPEQIMDNDNVVGVRVNYWRTPSCSLLYDRSFPTAVSASLVLRDVTTKSAAVLYWVFSSDDYRLVLMKAESTRGQLYQFSIPSKLAGFSESDRLEYCRGNLYIWKDCYRRERLKKRFVKDIAVKVIRS